MSFVPWPASSERASASFFMIAMQVRHLALVAEEAEPEARRLADLLVGVREQLAHLADDLRQRSEASGRRSCRPR